MQVTVQVTVQKAMQVTVQVTVQVPVIEYHFRSDSKIAGSMRKPCA